jgi:hypothetical protein
MFSSSRQLLALSFILSYGCIDNKKISLHDMQKSNNAIEKISTVCPDGYIPIPGDETFGTLDFCVMKWEAKAYKNAGVDEGFNIEGCSQDCEVANWAPLYHPETNTTGFRPVSSATAKPWRMIDQDQARNACSNLGSGYALISNLEWMTIAHNIYKVDSNWSSGKMGEGALNGGHSNDSHFKSPCDGHIANVYLDCATPLPDASTNWDQKRTHTLSNGEVIWDMAGNVWNWVDWNIRPIDKAFISSSAPVNPDGAPARGWREWSTLYKYGEKIRDGDPMATLMWLSPEPSSSSAMGIGRYFAGNNSSGGAALRGGDCYDGTHTGVFALNLLHASNYTNWMFGFRCVFRNQ